MKNPRSVAKAVVQNALKNPLTMNNSASLRYTFLFFARLINGVANFRIFSKFLNKFIYSISISA